MLSTLEKNLNREGERSVGRGEWNLNEGGGGRPHREGDLWRQRWKQSSGKAFQVEVTKCKGPEAEKDWVGEMSKCSLVGEAEKEWVKVRDNRKGQIRQDLECEPVEGSEQRRVWQLSHYKNKNEDEKHQTQWFPEKGCAGVSTP